jgi:hypothetical protein
MRRLAPVLPLESVHVVEVEAEAGNLCIYNQYVEELNISDELVTDPEAEGSIGAGKAGAIVTALSGGAKADAIGQGIWAVRAP